MGNVDVSGHVINRILGQQAGDEDDIGGGKNGNYPGYYLRSTVRACV